MNQISGGDDALLRSDLAGLNGADHVTYYPDGAEAVSRTLHDKLGDSINVKDYGAVGDGSTDDSASIQAALNACGARGGGVVAIPGTGNPYIIDTGLTIPEGVWLVGEGRTYHGPPYFSAADWSDRGTWLQPTDMVNPAITMGYGCGVRGLNIIYDQVEPVVSVPYVPTTFPYAIKATQSMFGIDDIWIIGGTHGINVEYNSANGGGTFSWLNNIFLDTHNVGIRWKNVNDTMKITNFHQRNLWHYNSAEVLAYRETNLIGWDVQYLDNIMADGLEFFQCAIAIKLTDSTVNNGGLGTITQACGYWTLSNVQFNLCKQAMKVAAGDTSGQILMQNVVAQSDIVSGSAADFFFDFGSDDMFVMMTNVWVNFVGRGAFKIGNGTGGQLSIGGVLRCKFNGNNGGDSAFSVGAGAMCAIPAGIHEVSPHIGSPAVFTGAGAPASIRLTTLYAGLPGNGDASLQGGGVSTTGYIEFRVAGGTRLGYIGFGTAGSIPVNAESGNVFRFNHAPMFAPGPSVTPLSNGEVTFQLTSNTQLTFKAKGSDGTVRSGSVTLA
jgi:hypothetical protein